MSESCSWALRVRLAIFSPYSSSILAILLRSSSISSCRVDRYTYLLEIAVGLGSLASARTDLLGCLVRNYYCQVGIYDSMAIWYRSSLLRLLLLAALICSFILLPSSLISSRQAGGGEGYPIAGVRVMVFSGDQWVYSNKMEKSRRKHQFQIRKVPLHRVPPSKTPQLYALDVHSICLPSHSRKALNWAAPIDPHYEESFNPQIIYSPAYQQLHARFLALKEQQARERQALKQEIEAVQESIGRQEEKEERLQGMRQGLYSQIESLRKQLNEVRDSNYNLRWEIYHQRGPTFMNLNGYSLLNDAEMTYEELLQIEEQIGSIPKGLSEAAIAQLPKAHHSRVEGAQPEICCICFDEVGEGEEVISLRCKHLHHSECLRDWLLKQRVCPICKQVVSP